MLDEVFVIFFVSFTVEAGRCSVGTTGADTSRNIDGALELAGARLAELSGRSWCSRVVIKIVRASDGMTVTSKNWDRQ